MNNAIIGAAPNMPAREIGIVTAEIKELCLQANRTALMYAIEIGRRLVEAKSVLPHGEWGRWLSEEVNFSQSSANNFMKLFEEYGSAQISIFGAVSNSQTIENLPYSKALQLLAVPADERESFAKEVDAENISVKELQAAIKERNDAIKEAEEAKERQAEIEERAQAAELARTEAEERAHEADALKEKISALEESLRASEEKVTQTKEKLKKAQSDPKIPPEKLAELKAEAEKSAKEEAEKTFSAELEEAKKAAKSAEAARVAAEFAARQAEERLEEAQKKLKVANPDVSAFGELFEQAQDIVGKMHAKIEKIRQTDPETADKLTKAMKAFGGTL